MQWDAARERWVVRWREAGRQRTRRFIVKDDAILFEADMKRRRALGHLAQERFAGDLTLGEYVATRYIPEHQAYLAPNTRRWQGELWDNHVSKLEGVKLKDLTAARIRSWQTERDRAGAGRESVRRALQFLGAVLQHASENDEIKSNPVRSVKPLPKKASKAVRAFSPVEVEKIIKAAATPQDRLLIATLAYSGARPAEALALPRERVLSSVIVVDEAGDGEGGVKDTKTGAQRAIRLFPSLAEDIAELGPTAGALFPTRSYPDGAWPKGIWANWRNRHWREAIEGALGFYVRPYDLRHTFASLLFAEGKTVHYVAVQMGHSAEECIRTYGHLIAEFDGSQIDAQEEIDKARFIVHGTPIPDRRPPAEDRTPAHA